jgi:anti-sigma regulatory factor (Ser/Thr protein kinase)
MGIHVAGGRLQMAVMDSGVGIFRRIAAALRLPTAPREHSGVGVFVASRMLDPQPGARRSRHAAPVCAAR